MNAETLTLQQLCGQQHDHVADVAGENALLHPTVASAYIRLREAAAAAGIQLAIASGFRSFERQLSIWNRKWSGALTLRDQSGNTVVPAQLNDDEKLAAILHWSALPGASRHHWGTDLDVYDPAPFKDNERQLQLIPSEYCDPQGPCFVLWQWLAAHAHEFGFFFPYAKYQGGVAQEPWHLSYRPISCKLLPQLTPEVLHNLLAAANIDGKTLILKNIDTIHHHYIENICEDNGWTNPWCGYSSF